ncbi:phosphoglucosamine mutase [Methylophilaceae bacterium]|jgi:phosphoglucosamine mutase|nr:phosphoglucosamine mutase [Methylophilaceae bacterium]
MKKFFGTDGIRGKTGDYPVTPDFFVKLGYAAGLVLTKNIKENKKPSVVIGKDTRISGYMLESSLEAGFSSAGVDVYLTGPIPTPAIAFLTQSLKADIGIMITASHNPYEDNGIKLFSSKGTKLSDEVESEIEGMIESKIKCVEPSKLGKARRLDNARAKYIEFCLKTFPKEVNLKKYKIVLDCAHGATYQVAPEIFKILGANIVLINNEPDGLNINFQAGSTHPEFLIDHVKSHNADLGIAFDGDGDRVIMVSDQGELVDGDQILYLIMDYYHNQNKLKGGVVGTLMTNLAFEEKCKLLEVPFERTNVGDRYVSEMLRKKSWHMGGENSGHIVLLNHHSTGDGIISSLQVISALLEKNKKISEALKEMPMYPQVLINIPLVNKIDIDSTFIQEIILIAKEMMNGLGRVLIRTSGTQPLLRIMTEGPNKELTEKAANFLVKKIKSIS